jgi:hypothetical protein
VKLHDNEVFASTRCWNAAPTGGASLVTWNIAW